MSSADRERGRTAGHPRTRSCRSRLTGFTSVCIQAYWWLYWTMCTPVRTRCWTSSWMTTDGCVKSVTNTRTRTSDSSMPRFWRSPSDWENQDWRRSIGATLGCSGRATSVLCSSFQSSHEGELLDGPIALNPCSAMMVRLRRAKLVRMDEELLPAAGLRSGWRRVVRNHAHGHRWWRAGRLVPGPAAQAAAPAVFDQRHRAEPGRRHVWVRRGVLAACSRLPAPGRSELIRRDRSAPADLA